MSTEEQDLILGRLMRQRAEAQRELAALQVKTADAAGNLRNAGAALSKVFEPGRVAAVAGARQAVESLPAREELAELLREVGEAQRRLAEIAGQLALFE